MATATLERQTEVVEDKVAAAADVEKTAAGERKERVEGSGFPGESRAWNAKAQVD